MTVAHGNGDTLFVVDAFHFTVQVLDSAGGFVSSIGRSGGGVGDLARPRDIAMDSEGHLYVTDAVRNDIKVYDQSGNLLLRIGGGGVGPGQFRLPAGITIDDDDRIYISDSINGRIQVLRFLSETG